MPRVTVRLFASLREKAGAAELTLDLPVGAAVRHAVDALLERLPALRPDVRAAAVAVNHAYAKDTTPLADGDELALIPPVSGGTDATTGTSR